MTASPSAPTLEQLWSRGHALLDARREPLADAGFADDWADALGAALAAGDQAALAELDALAATLTQLAAAEAARTAPPMPARIRQRTPWLALGAGLAAAAATLALTTNTWHTPEPSGTNPPPDQQPVVASRNPSSDAPATPAETSSPNAGTTPATSPLQPAQPRARIALKSLDRSSVRTPMAAATGRATLKSLSTTTRHTR